MTASKLTSRRSLRWLRTSLAIIAATTAAAAAGCSDGPTYGEIPRDGGKGGKSGNGGNGNVNDAGSPAGGEDSGGASGGDMNTGPAAGVAGRGGSSGGSNGGNPPLGGTSGTGGVNPVSLCGNSVIDAGETCDDGNKLSGDGCSAQCLCACEACEGSDACQQRGNHFSDETGLAWYEAGYDIPGDASGGPAVGEPRAELFRNAIDCVRRTKCMVVEPGDDPAVPELILTACFCLNPRTGGTLPLACLDEATIMPGPCLTAFQEASESDSLLGLSERLKNVGYPLGVVPSLLLNCDLRECRSECFTPPETAALASDLFDTTWACGTCGAGDACASAL